MLLLLMFYYLAFVVLFRIDAPEPFFANLMVAKTELLVSPDWATPCIDLLLNSFFRSGLVHSCVFS